MHQYKKSFGNQSDILKRVHTPRRVNREVSLFPVLSGVSLISDSSTVSSKFSSSTTDSFWGTDTTGCNSGSFSSADGTIPENWGFSLPLCVCESLKSLWLNGVWCTKVSHFLCNWFIWLFFMSHMQFVSIFPPNDTVNIYQIRVIRKSLLDDTCLIHNPVAMVSEPKLPHPQRTNAAVLWCHDTASAWLKTCLKNYLHQALIDLA